MPEWLQSEASDLLVGWPTLLMRLGLAAVFGTIIAGVYGFTQRRPTGHAISLITTLILLTILVAMTTMVIGDSVARAFGLVGALSIVRFRTVVDDTRDTSFVIFAVVVGMALGAGNLLICLLGVPVVSAVSLLLKYVGGSRVSPQHQRRLEVRIGAGRDPEPLLSGLFSEQLKRYELSSVVSARQGAALDLVYRVELREPRGMFALVKAIHALDGVQNVELKED